MKIFIPSKGRYFNIKTHSYLKDYDYKIILHNEEEKCLYMQNETIKEDKILVSNQPFGIATQRNWIQENLVEKGEWYLSLDDNIECFTALPEPYYSKDNLEVQNKETNWKELFETRIEPARFFEICDEMIKFAEKTGAKNLGFAVVDNFFFRGKKFREVGYVISKAVLRKTCGLKFNEEAQSVEDYSYTAECLLKHGKVLINNYVFPIAKHYESGGIGTYEERLPYKLKDCASIMKKYPGLFRYKEKSNCHPKAEIQINFTNLEQVENWRQSMKSSLFKFC